MLAKSTLLAGSSWRSVSTADGSWMLTLGSMSKAEMMARPSNRSGWLQTCAAFADVTQHLSTHTEPCHKRRLTLLHFAKAAARLV